MSRLPVSHILPLLIALCLTACSPVQRSATEHGMYSSGQPEVSIAFEGEMGLALASTMVTMVPSDTSFSPTARTNVAVFGDPDQGPILRHGHIIISQLSAMGKYDWAMETWPPAGSLLHSKTRQAGQSWTVLMMPISSRGDWFSEYWKVNGREAPRFWLIKRWSATYLDHTRIVAEYREPAPECMHDKLLPLEFTGRRGQQPPADGLILWGVCRPEIEAFSERADRAVNLDAPIRMTEQTLAPASNQPRGTLNMKKLVGEVIRVDRGSDKIK